MMKYDKSKIGGQNKYSYELISKYKVYLLEIPKQKWLPKDVLELVKNTPPQQDNMEQLKFLLWAYNQHKPHFMSDFHDTVTETTIDHTPHGLLLYRSPQINIHEIKKELDYLFQNKKIGANFVTPAILETRLNHKIEVKDITSDTYTIVQEALAFLRDFGYGNLVGSLLVYIHIIGDILGIDPKEIIEKRSLTILKYTSEEGIGWHFDNITYGRIYEIIGITIGNNDIYYDMGPVYTDQSSKPIRVQIENGALIFLTKDARYKWTHGIPNHIPYYKGRYSILFK
jgi:alkylated DNA repair dioxygenase AlkB